MWAVRLTKTRSQATAACKAGHVRVNGERAKAAQPVRPGDELRVHISGFDRILVVKQPITKRVGAAVAAEAMDDKTPPPPHLPQEVVDGTAAKYREALERLTSAPVEHPAESPEG